VLGLAVVVGLGVLAVEWVGRFGVDQLAADRIARDVPAESVDVVMGSAWWRPTVIPAVALGDVDRISVRLVGADLGGFPVAEVDYVLEGIEGNVSVLRRQVEIDSIERGRVRMLVDPSSIATALGTSAELVDRQLLIGPDRVPASVEVSGDDLVISTGDDAGVPAQVIPVMDDWLMPCRPTVRLGNHFLELSCDGDQLPGVLGGTFSDGGPAGRHGEKDATAERPPADLLPPETVDRGGQSGTVDGSAGEGGDGG